MVELESLTSWLLTARAPFGFSEVTSWRWVRPAVRANHNPPAATKVAITRNRCFGFIDFGLIKVSLLSPGIVHGFPGVGFCFGTNAENSGAKCRRTGMKRITSRFDEVRRGRSAQTACSVENAEAAGSTSSQNRPRDESSGSSGTPVFAGSRESSAWWDSSFRFSARPGFRL